MEMGDSKQRNAPSPRSKWEYAHQGSTSQQDETTAKFATLFVLEMLVYHILVGQRPIMKDGLI